MKLALVGIGLALVAVTSSSSPARADEAATVVAKEHFRRGTRAYDLGHFLEAAAEYEKAYEARENPALLYNLGQAYRGAGEHHKALNAYRSYLRNAKDAPNREEVARLIESLKRTIEAQKATTEKPPVGTLSEVPSRTAPPPSSTTTTTTTTIAPPPATVVAPPVAGREPDKQELALGRKLRLAGIGVGAFGAASLIAGGVCAGLTSNINHQLNNPPRTTPAPAYDKSLESKGRTDQILETTFFVVGGAAVAAGVTALVLGTQKIKRNSFALVPSAGPTQVSATFSMAF